MRKLKIVLGDLSYVNRQSVLFVPLGIAYLSSYAKKLFGDQIDIQIFKEPLQLLEYVRAEQPDLVGLTHYFWNTALNEMVSQKLRSEFGENIKIVWGGPSIDSDHGELLRFSKRYPFIDAFIPNEGEQGFANIVESILSGNVFTKPLDGVAFMQNSSLVMGEEIGLMTDLATVDSPYLAGLLDPFMHGDFRPMLQTTRSCPYTCAFCVSGKNVGKLRAFPVDQVKAEIDYIVKSYQNRPNIMLYIVDDNFGILNRDVEIAEYLRESSEKLGYPQKLFYYNDKQFKETSRDVHDRIGKMCFHGLTLALQTENPETLKVVKRSNMSQVQLTTAMNWGRSKGLPIVTELIFGLPMETRKSFSSLIDKCIEMNFDSIHCYNLIVFDGIEFNRPSIREKYQIKTKYRHASGAYLFLEGDFCAESEEVVVGASGFDFDDFRFIRCIGLLLYCSSHLRMHAFFFRYINELDIPFSIFCEKLFEIGSDLMISSDDVVSFIESFYTAIDAELFDTREALVEDFRQNSERTEGAVTEPVKINAVYGSQLIQHSGDWVVNLLRSTLKELVNSDKLAEIIEIADFLLELGARERVAGDSLFESVPLESQFDVIAWRNDGFNKPLVNYRIPTKRIMFTPSKIIANMRATLSCELEPLQVQQELYEQFAQANLKNTDLLYEINLEN